MKMKVGEIEFDSESHVVASRVEQPVGSPRRERSVDPKFEVERRGQRAVAVYGLVIAGSTAVVGIAAISTQSIALGGLAAVGILSSLGALVTILAVEVAARLRTDPRRGAVGNDAPGDRLIEARVSRLRRHLTSEPKTIQRLLEETGWSEEALLPALAALTGSGEVDEDLDLETGAWTYANATPARLDSEPPRHTLSLEDRIEAVASPHPARHATREVEKS